MRSVTVYPFCSLFFLHRLITSRSVLYVASFFDVRQSPVCLPPCIPVPALPGRLDVLRWTSSTAGLRSTNFAKITASPSCCPKVDIQVSFSTPLIPQHVHASYNVSHRSPPDENLLTLIDVESPKTHESNGHWKSVNRSRWKMKRLRYSSEVCLLLTMSERQ